MAHYRYRSLNLLGKSITGDIEAANPADLESRLQRMGLDLIRYEVAAQKKTGFAGGGAVKRRELITFCFHLEQLTRAGVPILEGLSDLRDTIEHPRFREIVADVIDSIEGGMQLSGALAQHPQIFEPLFISLIKAGEATGRLAEVLKDLTDGLKWQDELASQTKRIMIYPTVVAVVVTLVVGVMLFWLVPQLVELFKSLQVAVPLQTRILVGLSDFVRNFWWIILSTPFLIWGAIKLRLKYDPGFQYTVDGYKLRLPLIGPILRKIMLARFASYFAMLFSAGIPVLDTLKICEGVVNNQVIAEGLSRVQMQVREGSTIAQSFDQVELFPALVVRMLKVGENTGQLDISLLNVRYFYDRDVKESIDRVQALIEPAMTVVLGGILAWIMSSVLGPVFDLISTVGRS